jgi:hypothetical protein
MIPRLAQFDGAVIKEREKEKKRANKLNAFIHTALMTFRRAISAEGAVRSVCRCSALSRLIAETESFNRPRKAP